MGSVRNRRAGPNFGNLGAWALVVGLALAGPARARAAADESPGAQASPGSDSPTAYIDEQIQAAWDEAGIEPSPVASDAEFHRRAYLDLLGRIPSAEEAAAFLASKDKEKRAKLIERLLASPDYPKNFGTIWANLLVGRRPQGRQVDRAALAGWLREQFAEQRPWVEVVHDLVTAQGSNKENGAVNFTVAHLGDGAVNLTSYTTRLFLGEQIQCTQCHDHPSNDWKQADFWSINAFFKGVRSRDVEETGADGDDVYLYTEVYDEPTTAYATFERRNAMIGIAFPAYLDGRKISQGTDVDRRAELARFLTEPESLKLERAFVNRLWGQLFGRGFVEPVDDFGDHNPPSHPELLDRLARDFQANNHNVADLIRWITASRAYHLTSARTKDNSDDGELFSYMQLKPMSPEQLFDSLLVATDAHRAGGDSDSDGRRDAWLRQFIFTFGNDEAQEGNLFQGTIPQALMMMNGELIARATSGQPGSFLAQVRDRAMARPRGQAEFMVNALYLSALGRYPNRAEMTQASRYLQANPDPMGVMEDLFWALLNSNEFVLNH